MRSPEQEARITKLKGHSRVSLAAHYRRVSGHVGSPRPPEDWSKHDLINEIIRAEYRESPVLSVTNPVPQAGAPKPEGASMTDITFEEVEVGQRIHVFTEGSTEIAGAVASVHLTSIAIGAVTDGLWHTVLRKSITRIELLSEPEPVWPEGTLAEIDWTGLGGGTYTELAWRLPTAWYRIPRGGRLYDINGNVTAVRPKKLVPADAVVIDRDLAGTA